ncbi:MAG: DUF2333 family protein [Succinivibrio sp.]
MNLHMPQVKNSVIIRSAGILFGVYLLYIVAVGLVSSTRSGPYEVPDFGENATDRDKAMIMAGAVTNSLNNQLNSFFGWIPNDLMFVPKFLDNITSYQKGIIYATRPASDIVAKTISRYGKNDTMDPRLVDATSRYFVYSADVWGFWFIYDAEGKYKEGIRNWTSWAASVDSGAKNAGIYNVKSDDVYQILKYCNQMLEYALGLLNDENISHLQSDNNIYFAKGIATVVDDVLRGLIAVDSTVIVRGGAENVEAALNRLGYVRNFNPWYVVAGGNKSGDAMLPNHVAAIARHIDVAANRINDIMQSMEK